MYSSRPFKHPNKASIHLLPALEHLFYLTGYAVKAKTHTYKNKSSLKLLLNVENTKNILTPQRLYYNL
jgi:hypothetical protein